MKKLHLFCFISSFFLFASVILNSSTLFEKLSSNNESEISKTILILEKQKSNNSRAWKGAFQMKEAAFKKTIKEKSSLFNLGKDLLESEIKLDSKNVEFRLLRLIIQENAPKIVKYNSNITSDAKFIKENIAKCDSKVSEIAKKYAQKSSKLNL